MDLIGVSKLVAQKTALCFGGKPTHVYSGEFLIKKSSKTKKIDLLKISFHVFSRSFIVIILAPNETYWNFWPLISLTSRFESTLIVKIG